MLRSFSVAVLCLSASPLHAQLPPNPNRDQVIRDLKEFSFAGMDWRLGPDYAAYHEKDDAKFPEIWMAPSKQEEGGRRYQIGGPWTKKGGDFSSTQGQVLYVPDKPGPAVDRVTILEWSNGCFSERPEAPWWGGFRPEPVYKNWNEQAKDGDPGQPVCMARGMASWANCGVIVFSSGLVGTAGTVTGRGSNPSLQLPPNKLPTAISITNKNEFALITIVDTETKKGQVVVIALTSSGKVSKFAHEWPEDHPGLPNVAVLTGLRLLGYVDLPGLDFPTGI